MPRNGRRRVREHGGLTIRLGPPRSLVRPVRRPSLADRPVRCLSPFRFSRVRYSLLMMRQLSRGLTR
jgi:hypothetical protein